MRGMLLLGFRGRGGVQWARVPVRGGGAMAWPIGKRESGGKGS